MNWKATECLSRGLMKVGSTSERLAASLWNMEKAARHSGRHVQQIAQAMLYCTRFVVSDGLSWLQLTNAVQC